MADREALDMAAARWREALAGLHVHKRDGERAVHKPLLALMLLRRALVGESRIATFTEIEEPLRTLLEQFGRPRRRQHPEYPFWHLQGDGFWVVQDADALPLRRSGSSPPVTVLRDRNASGEVPQPLWDAIATDDGLRDELTEGILNDFWPETLHAAIRAAVGLPDPGASRRGFRARRDPAFPVEVLRAYEYCCAVCGYDGRLDRDLVALEAAHVHWHCEGGPDRVENGLALCSFHHKALDRGAFGLDADRRILVSRALHGGAAVTQWLGRFAGMPIRGPQPGLPPPAESYLSWHREQVFRGPARTVA